MNSENNESPQLGWGLRQSVAQGWLPAAGISDLYAGVIVGIVAIPLAMALAIASGAPPQNGLYTAIVAGVLTALLGGSFHQVSGPTAAFVVLLIPVVTKFGLSGLFFTCFLSGVILVLLGLFRLGSIIRLVPHPVTTGFTSGIALVIAIMQVKDFFGLKILQPPENFIDRLQTIWFAMPTVSLGDLTLGVFTLGVLVLCSRILKKIPAPIVAIFLATLMSFVLTTVFPHLNFETISTRFPGGIPRGLPVWDGSWIFAYNLSDLWGRLGDFLPSSLSIAALAAIESLLSASVASGMTRLPFNPNAELMAIGVANMVGPFWGGIPATGAIARTSTNIRFGAKTPLSAVIHGLFVLAMLLLFAPLGNYLPMASLAALLLFVAYNMSEKKHFLKIIKRGSFEDRAVLWVCFLLTVLFDMTIGVGVGLILACLLFINRMISQSQFQSVTAEALNAEMGQIELPKDVYFFQVKGAMFFGTAQRAIRALTTVSNDITTVVLDLTGLHLIDATGLTAFESALEELVRRNKKIIILGATVGVQKSIEKFIAEESVLKAIQWYQNIEQIP